MPSFSTVSSAPPKRRAGRTKFRETRHPVFKGVRRRRGKNGGERWVCEMREPNNHKSRIWLGTYPTPEMAARAHDVAALALRGRKACLNFADSAYRLADFIPSSSSSSSLPTNEDIKMAAAKAAEAFRSDINDAYDIIRKETSSVLFEVVDIDDDDTLDVVGYYASMAEGMMVDPPLPCSWDDLDCACTDDGPLWSYSI